MERFPPAKLIKACRKIIVFINLKIYDLMMFLVQVIKLNIIKTENMAFPSIQIMLYNIRKRKIALMSQYSLIVKK